MAGVIGKVFEIILKQGDPESNIMVLRLETGGFGIVA
jgi:hypothetical protein